MQNVESIAEIVECGLILTASISLNLVWRPILNAVFAESFSGVRLACQELSRDVFGDEFHDKLPVHGSLVAHGLPRGRVKGDCFAQSVLPFGDTWFPFNGLAFVFRRMAVGAWHKLVLFDVR